MPDDFARTDFEAALRKVVPPAKSKRNPHAEQLIGAAGAVRQFDNASALEAVTMGFALGLAAGEQLSKKTRRAFRRAALDNVPGEMVTAAKKAAGLPV